MFIPTTMEYAGFSASKLNRRDKSAAKISGLTFLIEVRYGETSPDEPDIHGDCLELPAEAVCEPDLVPVALNLRKFSCLASFEAYMTPCSKSLPPS